MLLPPPPPPPPVSKVTVIVTGETPDGEVGVSVTVADAPEVIPDELPFRRVRFKYAVVVELPLGETTSQLPEPVVSTA